MAALALIDMVKAVDRQATVEGVQVVAKSEGRSGGLGARGLLMWTWPMAR
ncbi:MAG: hypothetical protein ACR2FV_08550 [Ornithinimicrobium sp.]